MYGTALRHCCKCMLNFTHITLIFALNSNLEAHEAQMFVAMYICRIDIYACFIKNPFANKFVYILVSCGTTLFGDAHFLFLRTKL